jgi:GNAT superfamily N-acetyltransferase
MSAPLGTLRWGLQDIELREEPILNLADYGSISIAFEIERVLEPTLVEQGLGGILFRAVDAESRHWKDYDTIPGNAPADWPKRFNVTSWGLIAARLHGELVGAAVVAYDSPGVVMLEGRRDLAVLWDIRVAPPLRGHGVGFALWQAIEAWASRQGCRQIKIETQNTNASACEFYARQGCYLGAMNRFAYPELPHEIQLIWYKDLSADIQGQR